LDANVIMTGMSHHHWQGTWQGMSLLCAAAAAAAASG
jgi:hypothetical protein